MFNNKIIIIIIIIILIIIIYVQVFRDGVFWISV
jgi:hypothetical protein